MTDDMLSIETAALLLNVDPDYLVGLLDAGTLPSRGSGDARIVRRDDLLAFKATRDAQRREGLRQLTRLTEEFGGYDAERERPEP
jgi:excisionase family DNA binding protein